MDERINVGVDLHKTQFTICIKVGERFLEEGTKFEMNSDGYDTFAIMVQDLAEAEGGLSIWLAIESTANSRFFRSTMEAYGFQVVVVNTLRFKIVNESTKKTDKNDARTIVEFLSKDMLPQSNLCSAESEGLRRIIKSRSLMVQDAVALKNQAHAVLLAYGHITHTAQFQSKSKRELLLKTLPQNQASILKPILDVLSAVETQKRMLELQLSKITAKDHYVHLLTTIPGVGIVNACTIRAYIDDIHRFESYKNFSAYCGLVPWVQSSNETAYYGHITKRGPQELRTALVQCVVAMVRMEDKTKEFSIMKQYQQMKEAKSSGTAIIATARKLSRIIYMMLMTDKPFDTSKMK